MRVIITAATVEEWMPAFLEIDPLYTSKSKRLNIRFHQSGVGMLATAFSLTRLLLEEKPDLVIQAGIAGCFTPRIPRGSVLAIQEEYLGDTGVEEEGKWKDLFDLKLEKPGYPPYERRKLPNPWLAAYNLLQLPEVTAITVNTITTQSKQVQQLEKKYHPCLESMEGAALHYICRQMNTPFLQVRAVSNYIGVRDKSEWRIKEALTALNQALLQYVEQLYAIT